MPKAIIFGINGQDGFYLSQVLLQRKIEFIGVSRTHGNWVQGNVSERDFVTDIIKLHKPEYIFHLAANSKTSHELLSEHQHTIVNGTTNILEAVYHYSRFSRVFITGSGLQFINDYNPINEDTAFAATDAYSLCRIQSAFIARYYRSKGIKTYIGYLFHHDSPLRGAKHINRQIVNAAKTLSRLTIGDISVEKEFGFAGDIANGIFHLIQQENLFEACIGTGKAYSLEKWLTLCFALSGKNWKDYVEVKEDYTPDFKRLLSDPSVLKATGWDTRVSIEQLADLMMNHD